MKLIPINYELIQDTCSEDVVSQLTNNLFEQLYSSIKLNLITLNTVEYQKIFFEYIEERH